MDICIEFYMLNVVNDILDCLRGGRGCCNTLTVFFFDFSKTLKKVIFGIIGSLINIVFGHFDETKMGIPTYPGVG